MFIVSRFLAKALSWVFPVGAITIWPFVICRWPPSERLKKHERVHLSQWFEIMLVTMTLSSPLFFFFFTLSLNWFLAAIAIWLFANWLSFPIVYLALWIVNLFRGMTPFDAYYAHSMEKEARYWEALAVSRPDFAFGWIKGLDIN